MSFKARYGPWAIVAGASEGTGASFARAIAARGVNCILLARDGPLEEVAEAIRSDHGVEAVTAVMDLAHPDALERMIAAASDREIGLYVSNAGTDPFGMPFLDNDAANWLTIVGINVVTALKACHHFAGLMRNRGRGGLLMVNSGACYGGSRFLSIYSACKGFQLNFAESLWSELRPHGVDVLSLVLGRTDTPAHRRLQAKKGRTPAGLASPDDVAEAGLAHLAEGPVHNFGHDDHDAGHFPASADQRRDRVRVMEDAITHVFGPGARIDGPALVPSA